MASYTFETMTQTDASNFTSADYLFFQSDTVGNMGITDNPSTSTVNALGTTIITSETITLTEGSQSLTFNAAQLAGATTPSSGPDHLVFTGSNDTLTVGTDASADALNLSGGIAGHGAVAIGFGGADTITGGAANDTINGGAGNDVITGISIHTDAGGHFTDSDYLLGGNGADSITGSGANDHIYGNLFTSTAGAADGNDTINAGAGNDYVNGNAGDDVINGNSGNDRLYGGAGNDVIHGDSTVVSETGNDYIQGNKGNDTLFGDEGNDTIHGGADNDALDGGNGNDVLWGDAGNDAIVGGAGNDWISGGVGYDTLTGGTGNDTFSFAAGDDDVANLNTTGTNHGVVDVITDFAHAADKLAIGFTPAHVDLATGGQTFGNVDDAYVYAKGLLSGHGSDVASLQVNTDTYLFYDSTHSTGTVDSVVELQGFTASTLATGDFG